MNLTVNDLSPDQRSAYDNIIRWAERRDDHALLTLGGYAGSGKSTLVSLVAEKFGLPAFCAYTGKASSVLRRKLRAAGVHTVGVQPPNEDGFSDGRPFCGTIHSLIYRPCECREPEVVETRECPECETALTDDGACKNGHIVNSENVKMTRKFVYSQKDADGNCTICGNDGWLKRDVLDRDYGLIIVDEASMVTDAMLNDLRSFNIPILAVGDHGQLPPVGGSGALMANPHLRLERIHRQAEGNPIIALSKMVREQGQLPREMPGDAVQFGSLRDAGRFIESRYAGASPERLLEMSLAVYTNRKRVGLNDLVRQVRGFSRTDFPAAGEHLVCLRNMKNPGGEPVSNGMRGVLTTNTQPESRTHIKGEIEFPEDEIRARPYSMLMAQFGRDKTFGSLEELNKEAGIYAWYQMGTLFDFGYAMTVHKMQGSAFDDLLVCAERPGPVDDASWRKWLYTACTRSSKRLTVLRW